MHSPLTGGYVDSECHDRRASACHFRLPSERLQCWSSLRAITRNLLATGTPSLAAAFTAAARSRLRQTSAKRIATTNGLFTTSLNGIYAIPTPELDKALARARSLYGAGMGFASLGILSSIVKATVGLRWEDDGAMAHVLAVVDADISQAIQVCIHITFCLSFTDRIPGRVAKKNWKVVA